MREAKISLDETDFRALVSGEEVVKHFDKVFKRELTVRIILKDIGFWRMREIIQKAEGDG